MPRYSYLQFTPELGGDERPRIQRPDQAERGLAGARRQRFNAGRLLGAAQSGRHRSQAAAESDGTVNQGPRDGRIGTRCVPGRGEFSDLRRRPGQQCAGLSRVRCNPAADLWFHTIDAVYQDMRHVALIFATGGQLSIHIRHLINSTCQIIVDCIYG